MTGTPGWETSGKTADFDSGFTKSGSRAAGRWHSCSPQMTEPAVLAPTEEFFTMILYNSDPKSRVFLRRCHYPLVIFLSLALLS